MREMAKRYSIALDILVGFNFIAVIAATFGAAISEGDIKLTVILGAVNVFTILVARLSVRGRKND